MNRIAVCSLAVALCAATFVPTVWSADPPAERPADRVVAMYFHRTERCPTCQKMGSYAEEAVKEGFREQVKKGAVEFHYVDFQNKKNEALAKGYKVSGPALVVVKVVDNKVKEFKDLREIWTKVREKPEFLKYVRANVQKYLEKP